MGSDVVVGRVLLSARGLTRRYVLRTEVVTALEGVTIDVREQEYLAVLGPSGSGKTTLLQLLGGLDRPSAGTVHFRDRSLGELSERQLSRLRSREIGFVFQDALLMGGLDALGNVRLPQILARSRDGAARARSLLEQLGLGAKLSRLPGQLSRGEKQRVAIARALANHPACLIADEPTGNLDRRATHATFRILRDLSRTRGLTVVVASHDPVVLEYATRAVTLCDGRLAEEAAR
ncbi:MAG: ABC transporter ATP-binding protein [Planctomycetota bacterium]